MGYYVYKVGKKVRKFIGKLCWGAAPEQRVGPKDEELAFTTFIIKVNPTKVGWQKGIIKLLQNCKVLRFNMDGEGKVEISGISNPVDVMNKIGKSGKVELHWIQYGQCCANLYMPPVEAEVKKQDSNKDPPNPNYALPCYYYNHNINSSCLSLPYYYEAAPQVGYYAPGYY